MKKYVVIMQNGLKSSSKSTAILLFRIFTGLILGMTMALIGQEFFDYGNFLFYFVIISTLLAFLKISNNWGWLGVVVFNLLFIMLGMILRMYALMAPGV